MGHIVEAGSLSSITQIAANPPQQLKQYRPQHSQPLTLYIARVPGRRDVFLTPVKPRDKIVTAEDVQSSLYYVHINSSDDIDLVAKAQHGLRSKAGQRTSNMTDTREVNQSRPSVKVVNGIQQHKGIQARKAVASTRSPVLQEITNAKPSSQEQPQHGPPMLPPRALPALPPRPAPPPLPARATPHGPREHAPPTNVERYLNTEPDHNPYQELSPQMMPMTPDEMDLYESMDGFLTVIRRDPATTDQWNVAFISDDVDIPTSSPTMLGSARNVKSKRMSLRVEITNPAYDQFDKLDDGSHVRSLASRSFSRCLQLKSSSNRWSTLGSSTTNLSRTSVSSDDTGYRSNTLQSQTHGDYRSPSQKYSFETPWGSHCTFDTTTTGQSLRCLHQHAYQQPYLISELRFNLPHSAAAREQAGGQHFKPFSKIEKLHQRIQAHSDRHSISTLNRDSWQHADDDAMDLSLGQERAGGGFGGKQAKLGKLIIMPEGLAMLDLLVAANMGLWWRAYQRET